MRQSCYMCGEVLKEGQLVEVTVIAPWHEIKSNVAYSLGKPVDAYADTLRHNKCNPDDEDSYKV